MKVSPVSKHKISDPLIANLKCHNFTVLANRVLVDKEYADFYKDKSENGYEIILNNGADEIGESISIDDLILAANIIRPSKIVLPDKPNDIDKTIENSLDFLSKSINKLNHNPDFIAVIQGEDEDEWNLCLKIFAETWEVDTLGISPKNVPVKKDLNNFIIKSIQKKEIHRNNKCLHFFGLSKGLFEKLDRLQSEIYIEGITVNVDLMRQ